jgi:hypothetical protein
MRDPRCGGVVVALVAGAFVAASAQDSPFNVRGLGVPGRFESVRARATGGAFAAFDQLSVLSEAAVVDVSSLTATAVGVASYLTDDLNGVRGTRRTGRFPLFQVSGPLWHGVVLAGGFATYLDRSYRVVISDTITLGGSGQAVTDNLSSDGGVTDIRVVAAKRVGRIAFGAGFHLLTGSARVLAQRLFSDTSAYRSVTQTDEIGFTGMGGSASAMINVARGLAITVYGRSDTRLTSQVRAATVAVNDLPITIGGAVRWQPAPEAGFAAAVTRRSWASAADSGAFNTTSWSAGAQLGSGSRPFRFGVRGGDLPFGPGRAPREFAVAAGTGLTLAGGRGVIDLTLERLRRTGGGLTETGWSVLVGLTVRP